ncbi:hypothetical protein HN51_051753 [Arachis hypogaea]|uniref:Clathrin/coatomer adaptor adaptin-like N-terminal domain-containing protein n=1 Tax=Arachis hypogaea TaxID=3818 RepID=A0A445CDQ7_ARAHY|nr:dihydrolipoyllysine-residue succinyltransferase component of 2-oxoglutarate dehydrogenase complex 2, mitochondrial [Arachis hypogaea]XP_025667515.1 dihydrolipoyllysine-residue succinyltransferase component of 2-oxoglutarate dehydrogenase complex 2, mitochondrial [Arachis hypogaea]XP_025667516.1 dihydrolipoyllysine-residue succinyltransferase component of 2-oxoglutarate dehydrogenase complex 2, mitochondrial [Arachis hypogaea]XP_025667517.1 dihydrolipoyllysine-residue succinyltransferase compo
MFGVIRRSVASSSPYPMLLSQSARKFRSGSSAPARISSIVEKEVSFYSGHYGNVRNFSHMTLGCWVNLKPEGGFLSRGYHANMEASIFINSGDNVDVVVPPLAESIADGTLAKFLKMPGDRVAVDEPIAQIETDKVAMTHPMAVTNCNIDMESLISDQNRSIATLAITTLLKTGNESSVDRLMKQITNFMSDIADEFKIVVVEAIRSLCLKFPLTYRSLMNFLSNILREEGGFDYKKAIVDSIVILI